MNIEGKQKYLKESKKKCSKEKKCLKEGKKYIYIYIFEGKQQKMFEGKQQYLKESKKNIFEGKQ